MKKVIASIDNGPLSESICKYAIFMADLLKTEILFIHAVEGTESLSSFYDYYGLPAGGIIFQNEAFDESNKNNPSDEIKDAKKIFENAMKLVKEKGLRASIVIEEGNFADIIAKYAPSAEIFVNGLKGESDKDLNIGFNSEIIVKEFNLPVLLVNNEYSAIKKVLIAFDNSKNSVKILNYLKTIEDKLKDIKKVVININKDELASKEILDVAKSILGEGNTNLRYVSIKDDEPAKMILEHCEENNFDLIVSGIFNKNFLEKIFFKSISSEIMQKSTIPMLVIG